MRINHLHGKNPAIDAFFYHGAFWKIFTPLSCTLYDHFDRKVRFIDDRRTPRVREHRSVLDDPSWLSYYRERMASDDRPYEVKY